MKDYQGIAGVITCKENGECNASGPVFYIVKDGDWVLLSKSNSKSFALCPKG